VKLRIDLYDTIGTQGGFGLVDLLASFALFDDNPRASIHWFLNLKRLRPR